MAGFLDGAYLWVKAGHVIFVIFWVAGLFLMPRFLVYHQEALERPEEAALWIEREAKLRSIILTPSLVIVWVLGLVLAANLGLFEGGAGLGWLHAKLLLVLLLSGYHGWMLGYARKLRAGRSTLSGKTLRMVNEVPAIGAVLIVILAVVKPF